MRAPRAAALLLFIPLLLPLAGCVTAVDTGGQAGLQKRVDRLEKRIRELEEGEHPEVRTEYLPANPK